MGEQSANGNPGPAPRELNPRARRRAWKQPVVRFWWLLAVVFALVAAGFAGSALAEWNHERSLITQGLAINATVQQAGEQTIPGRKQPPDTICILAFDWNGQPHVTRPKPLEGRTEFVAPRDTVRIFVNRADPDDWTASSQPGPLGQRLVGAEIAFGVALAAFAVTLFQRSKLLRAWRNGLALEALVVESRPTALAPRTGVLRCTPAEENDRRLFMVYMPGRAARPGSGERVWLLTRNAKSNSAHAAAWFE